MYCFGIVQILAGMGSCPATILKYYYIIIIYIIIYIIFINYYIINYYILYNTII